MQVTTLDLGSQVSVARAAELAYQAARAEAVEPDVRMAIIDLGDGSLDCIVAERGRLELVRSLPLGVLAIAAQVTGHDLERRVERLVMTLAGTVLEQMRAREPEEVVLTSGTARTLLRVARAMGRIEPVVRCLSVPTVVAIASRLAVMNPGETPVLGVPLARCETIGVGAVVLASIVTRLGVPYVRVAQPPAHRGG
jgi:exopolyphosphatase/pppGpp-phosphohydrolase